MSICLACSARALAYNILNVYAIKIAGVFMFSTSVYTGCAPRWIAILGYVLALLLLLGGYYLGGSVIVLSPWVLLISGYVLIRDFGRPIRSTAEYAAGGAVEE